MRVLAIETSCDETAVAVLKTDGAQFVMEQNLIASQIKDHAKYGGVVPEVAARRHVEVLYPLLMAARVSREGTGIDAIAVTAGPGLVPSLRIGVEAAKTLALLWNKPLIAVNHLEGHLYSAFLEAPMLASPRPMLLTLRQPVFPVLALLVSGGHTELILMRDHGQYELLGRTRDDAAGEAFDKIAKLLGLGYPGGPVVSKRAAQGNRKAIAFPRPMLDSDDLDMSFSGLKTAVSYYLQGRLPEQQQAEVNDICASFEQAVVEVLVAKTLRTAEQVSPKTILLTGGVSANTHLRMELAHRVRQRWPQMQLFFAPIQYTTDNAAMIALAGSFRAQAQQYVDPLVLEANPRLELVV